MTKFYTIREQALIEILKAHPDSTIAEMKMHIGLQKRNDVPHALNGLRIKGVILHTDDKPPRYSFSDAGQYQPSFRCRIFTGRSGAPVPKGDCYDV